MRARTLFATKRTLQSASSCRRFISSSCSSLTCAMVFGRSVFCEAAGALSDLAGGCSARVVELTGGAPEVDTGAVSLTLWSGAIASKGLPARVL